jgi:hypothetical protein
MFSYPTFLIPPGTEEVAMDWGKEGEPDDFKTK